MQELNEAIRKLQNQSSAIVNSLYDTVNAARVMGMDKVANRSLKQIEMIESAVNEVSKAHSNAVMEYCRQAEASSANLFRTALAISSMK